MGDLDLRFYFSVLRRRLPYVLAAAFSVSAIGLVLAVNLPPIYRATAKIVAEAPHIPADLVRSTVPSSAFEQLELIEQEITARDNLVELAGRLNVYGGRGGALSASDIADNMKSRIAFEELPLDAQAAAGGTRIFKISFDARDPELAAGVVEALTAAIQQRSVDMRTGRAGDTVHFFQEEVRRLNAALTDLEAEILHFKNTNQNALPNSLDFRRNQQANLQERSSALDQEDAALRTRRLNLVRIFETTGRLAASALPASPDEQLLADLHRALSEQLSIFAEDSPNVAALRERIATVQARLQAQPAAPPGAAAGASPLDLQLAEIDERLAAIEMERSGAKRLQDDLASSILATPANETVLNALERRRQNLQTQYNTAVAKLAEASAGQQIEARFQGGRISVLEPAVPPQEPVSPKRRRIAALGVAAGIGLGFVLVALLEYLNPSIRRPAEIAELVQRPLLASIPYVMTRRERAIRRLQLASGTVAALCALPALLVAMHAYSLPIQRTVERLAVTMDGGRMM